MTRRRQPYHRCSGYQKPKFEAGAPQKIDRTLHQRFIFCSDRYINHLRSFESEKKLYESVKDVAQEFSKRDLQFFNQAIDILRRCRKTLAYSYMFVFYLKESDQSEIFEGYQRDLESFTEKLSQDLKRVLKLLVYTSVRDMAALGQVGELGGNSCYCESQRKKLVELVFEGYENDRWDFYNY